MWSLRLASVFTSVKWIHKAVWAPGLTQFVVNTGGFLTPACGFILSHAKDTELYLDIPTVSQWFLSTDVNTLNNICLFALLMNYLPFHLTMQDSISLSWSGRARPSLRPSCATEEVEHVGMWNLVRHYQELFQRKGFELMGWSNKTTFHMCGITLFNSTWYILMIWYRHTTTGVLELYLITS